MGHIAHVIFCEKITTDQISDHEIKQNALHILSRGQVPCVPALFSLAALIVIQKTESFTFRTFRLVVKNANGVVKLDTKEIDPKIQIPAGVCFNDADDLLVAMNIEDLTVDDLGAYSFTFYVNTREDYSTEFLFS